MMRSKTAGLTSTSLHSKVTYIDSEDLKPIDSHQEKAFKEALNNLVTSADWNVQFDACNIVRRVCKYH